MKIQVTITHVLELPDDTEIVSGAGSNLIKLDDVYIKPEIRYWQASELDSENLAFDELSEELQDRIMAALCGEGESVSSIE